MIEQLKAQIKVLQDQVKVEKEKNVVNQKVSYYTINREGKVIHNYAAKLPENGSYAAWIGETPKEFKTVGNFKNEVTRHAIISGMSYRITPILKSIGYKFDGRKKEWNAPVMSENPLA